MRTSSYLQLGASDSGKEKTSGAEVGLASNTGSALGLGARGLFELCSG